MDKVFFLMSINYSKIRLTLIVFPSSAKTVEIGNGEWRCHATRKHVQNYASMTSLRVLSSAVDVPKLKILEVFEG